jgi:hypothetical protein
MKIYGPISENGKWRSRYNHELYQLYEDSEIVKAIMAGRLRWLGHLYRANETDPCSRVTFTKIEGRRKKENLQLGGLTVWNKICELLESKDGEIRHKSEANGKGSWGGQGL